MTIDPNGKLTNIHAALPRSIADQTCSTLQGATARLEKIDINALVTHFTFSKPNLLSIYFGMNLGINSPLFFKHKEKIETEIDKIKKKKSGISLTPVSLCSAVLQIVDGNSYVLIGSERAYVNLSLQDFESLAAFLKKLI